MAEKSKEEGERSQGASGRSPDRYPGAETLCSFLCWIILAKPEKKGIVKYACKIGNWCTNYLPSVRARADSIRIDLMWFVLVFHASGMPKNSKEEGRERTPSGSISWSGDPLIFFVLDNFGEA